MAKEIELQNGMKAIVDDEDYERCIKHNWTYFASTGVSNGIYTVVNGKFVSMTRFILNLDDDGGSVVTHKNRNSLDKRKENLIITNRKQLNLMRKGKRNSSSKYKGVVKRKSGWEARITVDGKFNYLGIFSSEEEAAKAYNIAAEKFHGESAYQNIIGEDNNSIDITTKKVLQNRIKKEKSYRGVRRNGNRYTAVIGVKVNGIYKQQHLGNFKTEIEAAKAYNAQAKEIYGDKAILNDMPEKEESPC